MIGRLGSVPGWVASVLLLVGLTLLYAIRSPFPTNDAKATAYLPAVMLEEGRWTFDPGNAPFMFHWVATDRPGRPRVRIHSPAALRRAAAMSPLGYGKPPYYLAAVVGGGPVDVYASVFGPGPALFLVAPAALLRTWVGDLREAWSALASLSAWMAALLSALSCLVLHGALAQRFGRRTATLTCVGYALGTSTWSVTSQAFWQHTPAALCLAGALWAVAKAPLTTGRALVLGACLGAATLCRHPLGFTTLAIGVWLLCVQPRLVLAFVLGGLPFAALLLFYNASNFGGPLVFGQTLVAERVALSATGRPDPWQTPLWTGASVLLFSPVRGLFFHSPIAVFSIAGLFLTRTDRARGLYMALAFAIGAQWLLAFRWFDYGGGWSWAYRPLVDTLPSLAFCAAPAIHWATGVRWARVLGIVALVWSIYSQAVGALLYDARWDTEVAHDPSRHPEAMWSLGDSPLVFHTRRVAESFRLRGQLASAWRNDPTR